jgi:hypothetical protein
MAHVLKAYPELISVATIGSLSLVAWRGHDAHAAKKCSNASAVALAQPLGGDQDHHAPHGRDNPVHPVVRHETG